jgi:hypothetical protein
MVRTSEEKTIDRLLTLYSINECYEQRKVRGLSETKIQKLVFLSEKSLIDQRIKAFNYRFIRLLHPTFSKELSNDLTSFIRMGCLREPWLERTSKMKMILEDFSSIFERNSHVTRAIDAIVSTYAGIPTNRLVEMVYKMPWARNRVINDLTIGVPMLYPLKHEKARETFTILENELEDLEICLNPKLSREIDQAFNEMRRGRLLSHAEVFG